MSSRALCSSSGHHAFGRRCSAETAGSETEGRSESNLPTIWLTPRLGYQLVPDDITNSISVIVVAVAIYYAVKIVRLSNRFEYVALKGGRAPYYIVAGLFFLELDRIIDLLTNWLSALGFSYQLALTFNDPPAALAGLFIALGLRDMYVVYIRNSKTQKPVPTHDEIWETERN